MHLFLESQLQLTFLYLNLCIFSRNSHRLRQDEWNGCYDHPQTFKLLRNFKDTYRHYWQEQILLARQVRLCNFEKVPYFEKEIPSSERSKIILCLDSVFCICHFYVQQRQALFNVCNILSLHFTLGNTLFSTFSEN